MILRRPRGALFCRIRESLLPLRGGPLRLLLWLCWFMILRRHFRAFFLWLPPRIHRWSNGWTTRKDFRLQAAPVVQRMDHRERFRLQGCSGGPTNGPSGKIPPKSRTGGPTDGPPGKVSPAKRHRWSNGWTAGKGFPRPTAPVVQRMDHRKRIPPPGCTCGPTDGPPGKNSASRLHRWSNGWTTGKGFPLQTAPVVQRMDHRHNATCLEAIQNKRGKKTTDRRGDGQSFLYKK